MWGTVAQWLERANDDRVVAGSNPSGAASKLGQVRILHIACVFRMRNKNLAVGPFYLVSMPGEVKYITRGINMKIVVDS